MERYFAKDGTVRERTHGGALSHIVVRCQPMGKAFACPAANAMAITIAAALNAEQAKSQAA